MSTDKKTKPALPEKTETEILFPEKKVNNYELEPWGLKEISLVAPIINKAIGKCKDKGINLKTEHLSTAFLDILPLIYDEVLEIIAITTGDSIENIISIKPRSDGAVIAMTILYQNMEYIKGFFGMFPAVIEAITA